MPRTFTFWASLAIVALLALPAQAQSQTQAETTATSEAPTYYQGLDFLRQLAGSWQGDGLLRHSVDAKQEKVRCHLKAKWDGGSSQLQHALKCLGVDVKFNLTGHLTFLKSSNIFVGVWQGSGGIGRADAKGRVSENILKIDLRKFDVRSGESSISKAVIQLSPQKGWMMNTFRTPAKGSSRLFEALTFTLTKQGGS